MSRFILRRLGFMVLTVILASVVIFWATTILPGETNTPIMNNRARPPLESERAVMLDPLDVARAVLLCASLQKGAMIPELQICPTFMRDTSADIETARWVGAPDDTPDKPKK